MDPNRVMWSVFAKPWPELGLGELGALAHDMGFDAVELPVRPGYQVPPERVSRDLVAAARQLADQGVAIASVAGPADDATIVACGEAGVPVLRVMASIETGRPYVHEEARIRQEYDALRPALEAHHVTLGIQNHLGDFVANALALDRLLAPYSAAPHPIAAVWDAGHEAVCGIQPEQALDIIWPRICMVNLKNAYWRRANGPEARQATWRCYWTSGRHGLADWPRVLRELARREYRGVICLTAEYSDHSAGVERLAREDLAFAKALWEEAQP